MRDREVAPVHGVLAKSINSAVAIPPWPFRWSADAAGDPSFAMTSLTNRGTADGAEIAASALLGNKRAQVIGERTYGDAALRKALTMDDGSAIILSVAKYYSADGKAIQDTGVTPSTPVAEAEAAVTYDENGEPVPEAQPQQPQPKKLEDDPVVKKALEVLG